MTMFVMMLLCADPVLSVRIERPSSDKPPVVRVSSAKQTKVCAAGPHARLYELAFTPCVPGDAAVSAVELKPGGDVQLFVRRKNRAIERVVCAIRPVFAPLLVEAEDCLAGR